MTNLVDIPQHVALRAAKALCVRRLEWDNVYVPGTGTVPKPRRSERNKRLNRVILHLEGQMQAICLAR